MPAYYLEIIVVVLGLILLMAEAFLNRRSKDSIAFLAIIGLCVVLGLLMYGTDCEHQTIWGVYRVDHWAHFYKGIALVTTIIVLIMSLSYKSVLKDYTSQDETHAGIGEFYALPLFACAGLMGMASAVGSGRSLPSAATAAGFCAAAGVGPNTAGPPPGWMGEGTSSCRTRVGASRCAIALSATTPVAANTLSGRRARETDTPKV